MFGEPVTPQPRRQIRPLLSLALTLAIAGGATYYLWHNHHNSKPSVLGETTRAQSLIGLNAGPMEDWSRDFMFVDLMKQARPWDGTTTAGWDENGYPKAVSSTPISTYVSTTDYPKGRYTVRFDGDGELAFDQGASVASSSIGTYLVDADPAKGPLHMIIKRSRAGNQVRNIRIIRPGFETTYDPTKLETIFDPDYISRMGAASVIRFMDAQHTNWNPLTSWNQRTLPSRYTQVSDNGIALEYLAAFANRSHRDIWITIPKKADDEYIRKAAQLFKDKLSPDRKLYVEYSNEIWNGGFDSEGWYNTQGRALRQSAPDCYAKYTDEFQNVMCWQAKRSADIFRIFNDVWGTDASRVVKVIATQAANTGTAERALEAFSLTSINPSHAKANALAIAPYFGHTIANELATQGLATATPSSIIERLQTEIRNPDQGTARVTQKNKAIADHYGLQLIAYEGGQHLHGTDAAQENTALTDKLIAANRDPKMEALYTEYLKTWFDNGGGLFVHFNFISGYNKYGSWGLLETRDQATATAPKYRAVMAAATHYTTDTIQLPTTETLSATATTSAANPAATCTSTAGCVISNNINDHYTVAPENNSKIASTINVMWDGKSTYTVPATTSLPLSQGLIGLWHFNNPETLTYDTAGKDNPVTITGATLEANGRFGGALQFTNPTDVAAVAGDPLKTLPASGYTVATWLKIAATSTSDAVIFERRYSTDIVMFANTTDIRCRITGADGKTIQTTGFQLPIGSWQHVACVQDTAAKTLTLYVNGSKAASINAPITAFKSDQDSKISIGNRLPTVNKNAVRGVIDETAMWSRPLSAAEVKTLATLSGDLISLDPGVITSKSLTGANIDGVSATWQSQGTVSVNLSTDGGKTWCAITKDGFLTDAKCRLPATDIRYRVELAHGSSIDSLNLTTYMRDQTLATSTPPIATTTTTIATSTTTSTPVSTVTSTAPLPPSTNVATNTNTNLNSTPPPAAPTVSRWQGFLNWLFGR